MSIGLIAKKIGMTRVFDENGKHVPVTVLHVEDCQVIGHRTEDKNGYTAVQLGAFNQKAHRVNKAEMGNFKAAKAEAKKVVKEFRTQADLPEIGSSIGVDQFNDGQYVDITGTSKGKGFTGAMKRWNFGGLRASHGVSISHRSHGSTGQCQEPGKVFKGKKMAGHSGNSRVTQQNLQVVKVDADKGVLLIKGSIPGAKGQTVLVRDAVKKPLAA